MTVSWPVLLAGAVALIAAVAAMTYWLVRGDTGAPHDSSEPPHAAHAAPEDSSTSAAPAGADVASEVVVTLTSEAVERAGIRVTPASAGSVRDHVRLPAVVEPNAYKQVTVTPLVAGRVTRVAVALGDRVRRGQVLAEVYSPELADAQREYLSYMGEYDAAHQQLRRTERLVEIGAASQQEVERTRAEHIAHETHLEGARSRLVLLGMAPADIEALRPGRPIGALTTIPAPLTGVVVERDANAGLNVDAASKLFTIVDLTTVWVVGDLYERDLARVAVGSPATVTTPAYPDLRLNGRVSYIDPRVSASTRTARLRVEVANADLRLRLGMYVDLAVGSGEARQTVLVPRGAVQTIADRHVVYVADSGQRGRFTERDVRLGTIDGDRVEVLAGLRPGEPIVTEGSFSVRAERERLGLGQPRGAAGAPAPGRQAGTSSEPDIQTARILVSNRGFEPPTLTLRAGVPARITFVRTTDATCGTEVMMPSHSIQKPLPLNEPVDIEFTPGPEGEVTFSCGMGMLRGTIVPQ